MVKKTGGNKLFTRYKPLVSMLLLTTALALSYLIACLSLTPPRYELEVGDTVTRTVYANRDIKNEAATEILRNAARENTPPIYRIDEELKNSLIYDTEAFFDSVKSMRSRALLMLHEDKRAEAPNMAPKEWSDAISDTANIQELMNILTLPVSQNQLFELLAASDPTVQLLYNAVVPKITTNLAMLAAEKVDAVRDLCMREHNASGGLTDELKNVGGLLFDSYIQPTYLIDEQATEDARNEAALAVTDEVIKNGEVIVSEGSRLTAIQYTLLCDLGIIRDASADISTHVGIAVYVLIAFGAFFAYMYFCCKSVLNNLRQMSIIAIALLMMLLSSWACRMLSVHFMPYIIAAMMTALLVGERPAYAVSVLSGAIMGLIAGGQGSEIFNSNTVIVCLGAVLGGIASTLILRKAQKRGTVITAGLVGGATAALMVLCVYIALGSPAVDVLKDAALTVGGGLLAAVLCAGTSPVWESLFDISTGARLNELTNTNHPLIKQLMTEAPGTYHHSAMVASLAEAAAEAIGANAPLARVGAYFHDVGKLRRPKYFKENQDPNENIHDSLSPAESASIIIAHQHDSVVLLQKYRLPSDVIKIAGEHHGNSLMAYFYFKAQQESDAPVNQKEFRYSGSRPSSVESAIVMLADCCEAAVRSINSADKAKVEEMVHKVIASKYSDKDGLLMNAPLTLAKITIVERSFLKTFLGLLHERIEYPE